MPELPILDNDELMRRLKEERKLRAATAKELEYYKSRYLKIVSMYESYSREVDRAGSCRRVNFYIPSYVYALIADDLSAEARNSDELLDDIWDRFDHASRKRKAHTEWKEFLVDFGDKPHA